MLTLDHIANFLCSPCTNRYKERERTIINTYVTIYFRAIYASNLSTTHYIWYSRNLKEYHLHAIKKSRQKLKSQPKLGPSSKTIIHFDAQNVSVFCQSDKRFRRATIQVPSAWGSKITDVKSTFLTSTLIYFLKPNFCFFLTLRSQRDRSFKYWPQPRDRRFKEFRI